MHYINRVAVTEASLARVKDSLLAAHDDDIYPISPVPPQVAFLFTGQGAHYAGLGNQLFQQSSQFKADIHDFDAISQSHGFPSFMPLIENTHLDMALVRLWLSWGIVPSVVPGYSLGEYAALNAAGVLSASDTTHLVGKRALELEQRCTPDCPLEIACINSSSQTVLGGSNGQVDQAAQELARNGIRSDKLRIPFAFHISQVDPVLDVYENIASGVTFSPPSISIISPLLGAVVRSAGFFGPAYGRRHARETVNLPNGLDAGFQDGVLSDKTVWVEVGPHPVCTPMIKNMAGPTVSAVSSLRRNENTWRVLSASLASLYTSGLAIDWNEYHGDFNAAQQLLRLPTYGFDLNNYWIYYTGNWKAFEGHQVNNNALCPSSLYADMAVTVARYMYERLKPGIELPAMSINKMEVSKSLIAGQSDDQRLRLHAEADIDAGQVKLDFYTNTSEGKKRTDHAKCSVSYIDAQAALSNWKRYRYLIKPRVEALMHGVNDGTAEKMHRNTAYSLFGSFVKYGASYRGIEEVNVNLDECEATAKVAFQTKGKDGTFVCSPYWIDSIGHLSGFVDKVYRSYVKMQPASNEIMAGDVFLFEENEIVAVIEGITFQAIPRRLLDTFLPPPGGAVSKTSVPPIGPKRALQQPKPEKPRPLQTLEPPQHTHKNVSERALAVAAAEIRVPISELSDNVVFADIGVDSLMSLTISSRLREELGTEISSNLFIDCPSVADFIEHFWQKESPSSAAIPGLTKHSTTNSSSPNPGEEDIIQVIRATIADEMDIQVEEIVGATDLASLGMDSLLSLTVLAKLRETTGRSFSSNFFIDNASMEAITNALSPKAAVTRQPVAIKQTLRSQPPLSKVKDNAPSPSRPSAATSLLLQGDPKTARKTLFLFPDGSGSATSYTNIPPIAPDVALYGLNCPFMRTPDQFTCGIPGIATFYKNELRRRQPGGPYYLGGWSAGGVVAYEVCLQLIADGESIACLILLDSPCPIQLETLSARLHVFLDEIGLLGTSMGTAPEWLLPHFEYMIKALDVYKPRAIADKAKAPKTFAVWATEGVCPDSEERKKLLPVREDDTRSMKWLLNDRTDFGANGWDELIPGVEEGGMRCRTIEGNHFTMMRKPRVDQLAALVREGLE
ncbi:MAG: hypothetical protein Q9221_000776 [Calogaya cf. arnoldii]